MVDGRGDSPHSDHAGSESAWQDARNIEQVLEGSLRSDGQDAQR
jgi:hypothetical protein